MPYQVLDASSGAAAFTSACTFRASERAGSDMAAFLALTCASPSAPLACARRSRAYSFIAAFSSAVNPLATSGLRLAGFAGVVFFFMGSTAWQAAVGHGDEDGVLRVDELHDHRACVL